MPSLFTWNFPPLPLAQTKTLPSPFRPRCTPSSDDELYLKSNSPTTPSVCLLVCINFLKGQEVTLPCSNKSTCLDDKVVFVTSNNSLYIIYK